MREDLESRCGERPSSLSEPVSLWSRGHLVLSWWWAGPSTPWSWPAFGVSLVSNSEKALKKMLHFYTCKLVVMRLPLNYSCFFMCVWSISNICKASVCPRASKHSFWMWHYYTSRTWTQSTEFGDVTQEHLWLSCTVQLWTRYNWQMNCCPGWSY